MNKARIKRRMVVEDEVVVWGPMEKKDKKKHCLYLSLIVISISVWGWGSQQWRLFLTSHKT